MIHERAHARGKGNIGGGDLPTNHDCHKEDSLKNSLDGMSINSLETEVHSLGSIADATKSNPAAMKPGMNNKR